MKTKQHSWRKKEKRNARSCVAHTPLPPAPPTSSSPLFVTHAHTHSLSCTPTHSISRTHAHTHTRSLSPIQRLSISHSLFCCAAAAAAPVVVFSFSGKKERKTILLQNKSIYTNSDFHWSIANWGKTIRLSKLIFLSIRSNIMQWNFHLIKLCCRTIILKPVVISST